MGKELADSERTVAESGCIRLEGSEPVEILKDFFGTTFISSFHA